MAQNKVFIVGGNSQIADMFLTYGWETTDKLEDASLVQFTGGEDVSPNLYNEERHPKTFPNPSRDAAESKIFHQAQKMGLACAGICRGGQFLNVMVGGSLWQDVDGHTSKHWVFDLLDESNFVVTSTHHQMMIPAEGAQVVMVAWESSRRTRMRDKVALTLPTTRQWPDIECLLYPRLKVLCFQPHPEYKECSAVTTGRYFDLIENHLGA